MQKLLSVARTISLNMEPTKSHKLAIWVVDIRIVWHSNNSSSSQLLNHRLIRKVREWCKKRRPFSQMKDTKKRCKIEMPNSRHLSKNDRTSSMKRRDKKSKSSKSEKFISPVKSLILTISTRCMRTRWSRCRESASRKKRQSLASRSETIHILQWSTKTPARWTARASMVSQHHPLH